MTTAKKASSGAAKAARSNVAKVVEGNAGRATKKAGEAKAKVAANAAKVQAMNDEAKLEDGKIERIAAAGQESKAAKEAGWKWNGEKKEWEQQEGSTTPRPPTPNLDAINAGDGGARPATARKAAPKKAGTPQTPKAKRQPLWFLVNGEPVNDAFNNLAGISRVTARNGGKRLPTKELRKLLVKAGIEDPDNSVWKHKLPNGVVISTTKTEPKRQAKKAS